jgi:S-adenosylhomocysteine hydrolase
MSQNCMLLKGKLVFVMGGGNFGTKALKYLKAKRSKVLVADVNPDCMAKSEVTVQTAGLDVTDSLVDGQTAFLVGDAVELLLSLLETKVPDLIVTAIPGNAAAKIVESWLAKRGYKLEPYLKVIPRVLENIPKSLVSLVDEDSAVIVVSYMPSHMRCRENCMPPKDFCASTGRPKLTSMDKLLKFSVYNLTDASTVFRSRQLTGGLGAIDGKELYSLLKQLGSLHKTFTLAVGTACDCHGILNLTKVKK